MYSTAVSKCDPLTSNTVAVTKQKLIIINTFDRSFFFFLRRCTVDDWFAKDHKVSRVEWVRRAFLSRRKCSQHYRCRILDEKGRGKNLAASRTKTRSDVRRFFAFRRWSVRCCALFAGEICYCFRSLLSLRYVRKTKSELISCRIEPLTSSLWFREM